MKKIIITLIVTFFSFCGIANARTALCLYTENADSYSPNDKVAIVFLDSFKREIFFNMNGTFFDKANNIANIDDSTVIPGINIWDAVGLSPIGRIENFNQILTVANYYSKLKENGFTIRFDPFPGNVSNAKIDDLGRVYTYGYFVSDMFEALETRLRVTFGMGEESGESAYNYQKFAYDYVCPEVLYFDGDSVLSAEDAEIVFSYDKSIFEDNNSTLEKAFGNTIYYKRSDIVADSYRSDTIKAAIQTTEKIIDNKKCDSTFNDSAYSLSKLIKAMNFSACYNADGTQCAEFGKVEQHIIAKSLNKNDGFNYYKTAKNIVENSSVFQGCTMQFVYGGSNKALVEAARNFVNIYEGKVSMGQPTVKTCKGIIGDSDTEGSPAYYVVHILKIARYAAIVIAIALTTMDAVKAISASDVDAISKLIKTGSIRLVFVALIYMGLTIVNLLLSIFHITSDCGIK